jgi:hypothetical protein
MRNHGTDEMPLYFLFQWNETLSNLSEKIGSNQFSSPDKATSKFISLIFISLFSFVIYLLFLLNTWALSTVLGSKLEK